MSEIEETRDKTIVWLDEHGAAQFSAGYSAGQASTADALKVSQKAFAEQGEYIARLKRDIRAAENRGYETARKDISDLTNRMIGLETIIEEQRGEIIKQRDIIGDLERKANKPSPSGRFFLTAAKTPEGSFLNINFHDSGHSFRQPVTAQQLLSHAEDFTICARHQISEIERRHAINARNPDDGSPRACPQNGSAIDGID